MPVRYSAGRFPPDERLNWARLIPLLGPTAAAIARYDGMLSAIPNPEVMLSPLTTQEAVLSCRIEGAQATIGDVLEFEARRGHIPASSEQKADIREVLNCRSAMRETQILMERVPLSQRVIRTAHEFLWNGIRGKGKSAGEFRQVPVWTGLPGCSIEDAAFVPISADHLPEAMSAWERYIHGDAADRLVQLAILHAEFEGLHPFLNGNGHLGRMFVPLLLWHYDLIRTPIFYVSSYFESHRDAYCDSLLAVSRDDDWTGWAEFFLRALKEQAEDNLQKSSRILELYESTKTQISEITHSQNAIRALDWIFEHPIFKSSDFGNYSGMPRTSVLRFLSDLQESRVLRVFLPPSGNRSTVLIFPALMNIAEGEEEF